MPARGLSPRLASGKLRRGPPELGRRGAAHRISSPTRATAAHAQARRAEAERAAAAHFFFCRPCARWRRRRCTRPGRGRCAPAGRRSRCAHCRGGRCALSARRRARERGREKRCPPPRRRLAPPQRRPGPNNRALVGPAIACARQPPPALRCAPDSGAAAAGRRRPATKLNRPSRARSQAHAVGSSPQPRSLRARGQPPHHIGVATDQQDR